MGIKTKVLLTEGVTNDKKYKLHIFTVKLLQFVLVQNSFLLVVIEIGPYYKYINNTMY